jgi:hypothetical protein
MYMSCSGQNPAYYICRSYICNCCYICSTYIGYDLPLLVISLMALPLGMILWGPRSFSSRFLRIGYRLTLQSLRPRLRSGTQRLEWDCSCGRAMSGDYATHEVFNSDSHLFRTLPNCRVSRRPPTATSTRAFLRDISKIIRLERSRWHIAFTSISSRKFFLRTS